MTPETTEGAARPVSQITPITFETDARELARGAYDRLLVLLDHLDPGDWDAPTDCPDWTVADLVGHLIGAAHGYRSLLRGLRQQLRAARHRGAFGGNLMDALNALAVRDHARLTPAERVAALRAAAPEAVAGRMRLPRPLRRIRIANPAGGSTAPGMPESLTMGHLMSTILTRDVWLHTVDIARATGRDIPPDSVLDGRIVEDVVAEWAGRHGQPFRLTLSGAVRGQFYQLDPHAAGAARLSLDAVEFCRILSGRVSGEGLLATRVLF